MFGKMLIQQLQGLKTSIYLYGININFPPANRAQEAEKNPSWGAGVVKIWSQARMQLQYK